MKILAIETATEACSAALLVHGQLFERLQKVPQAHSKLLLPMVDDLLAKSGLSLKDLDAVAFGCGPGSFTGLRIAAGITQGIAFAAGLPVIPVSTLATLALGAARTATGQHRFLVALDARMQEVYWACYQTGSLWKIGQSIQLVGEERLCPPQEVPHPPNKGWMGVGNGWATYRNHLIPRLQTQIAHQCDDQRYPRAAEVALLALPKLEEGDVLPPQLALPVYLRDQVAKPPVGFTL